MARSVLDCGDAEGVAHAAAREFVECAREAVASRGAFRVALAGGRTPQRTYELLAEPARTERVDWNSTHVFFGDERAVPPDHLDSNFRAAHVALLAQAPASHAQVHRMPGERGDLKQAAREYEEALANVFEVPRGEDYPRFDLVLLGMGGDGHTASLFPHTDALTAREAWVVANDVPSLRTRRLTLTAPLINAARCVIFLVAGGEKAEALWYVLEGPRNESLFPAQSILPTGGRLLWLVDRPAAANLKERPHAPETLERRS